MICKPCRSGADSITLYLKGMPVSFMWKGLRFHKECTGCDCQHGETD